MRTLPALLLLATLALGCGGTEPTSNPLTGTYSATVFQVVPSGQSSMNVLAAGGSLSITINADNSTTGSLNIPASITGGAAFVASMAGTATISGSVVQFQQTADTFVRDLDWTFSGNSLTVTNQLLSGDSHTITLTR